MKKKILAIQGSSLKRINIKTDTSFFLGLEAQRRNYDIYYYEPKDLSFVNGKVVARCSKLKFKNNTKKPIEILKKSTLNLINLSEKSFSGTSLKALGLLIIFNFLMICSKINVVFMYC